MSASRLLIAERSARQMAEESPLVQAVLLVGSVARGTESKDSDVDLAVFAAGGQSEFVTTRRVDGVLVEADSYRCDAVPTGPATPLLALQDLRDAGRFATGKVLFNRWPRLADARRAWRAALLHPDSAGHLLGLASNLLDPARLAERGDADRRWMLQGAAGALAVLWLSLRPCRFQKPKWVMRDLRDLRSPLLATLRGLHSTETFGAAEAARFLAGTADRLGEGLRLGGLPELGPHDLRDHEHLYIYRTYCDARSLLRDGDFEGCVYTAFWAIRLLNALLQERAAGGDSGVVDAWREQSTRALFPGGGMPPDAAEALIQTGRRLQDEYRGLYLDGGPFEVMAEGAWRLQTPGPSLGLAGLGEEP